MTEHDLRAAAENLVRSNELYGSLQHPVTLPGDLSHSHSINTIASIRPEYVISEELFAGQRINGRMSNVRRFFCLFVTFDLLFSSLMWLICILLNGDNVMTALAKQIYHYDIHKSLFDVVVIAICRFAVLMFFYALLSIDHWIVIALSTTCTCMFLIAKVFVYDFQTPNQSVFQVLLVLISFVLSWGEAWFLDFRVIPQEVHARQYLIASPDTERAPLLRNYIQQLPSMYTESIGNFYSPLGSREGSLHRFEPVSIHSPYQPVRLTQQEIDSYIKMGGRILTDSWNLVNNSDWKNCKENNSNDIVDSMSLPKNGKIFRLGGMVPVPPKCLLDELFYRVERITDWNSAVFESHKVQTINEHTDICYQVSTNGAGGAVSSRDFVTFRHWGMIDGCYVLALIATEHPSVPKMEKYIRGENRLSCMVARPVASDPDSCYFQWVLNTDLKGWISPYILNTAFVAMLFKYITDIRDHMNKLKQSGNLP